jgi:excisionase family DNA binding protein
MSMQASQSIRPELFTNDQAAEYLSVTPGTLEVWRSTKRYIIPFIKVGRNVRYRRSDLDEFLKSRTVGAHT